jgi:hypothetical protein
MDFYEVVGQVLALLQRQGRVSYRALKRQFGVDEAYIEDLKEEIIHAQRLAVDEDNRVLVWIGEQASASAQPPVSGIPALTSAPATDQTREPLSYTPKHLSHYRADGDGCGGRAVTLHLPPIGVGARNSRTGCTARRVTRHDV